jgi:hypothetical protein
VKKLYLVEYSYRKGGTTERSKMAVEADDIKEAIGQFLAMPQDEFEAADWTKMLLAMETFNVTFYCYK